MKSFAIIWTAGIALSLNAQSNSVPSGADTGPAATPAAVSTNTIPPERLPTEIFSDSANFDLKSRVAVYIGHVRVDDPQMKLTCGIMTARVPESGPPDSIVAEQDVVIDAVDSEGAVHATAEKAVYTFRTSATTTNRTIELTGNPVVEKKGITWKGDVITWDLLNYNISGKNLRTTIPQEMIERTGTLPGVSAEKK